MLHIVTGPMFSGKTTFLSNVLKTEKCLYVNHTFDNRSKGVFYSHNLNTMFSEKINCVKTDKLSDELIEKYDIIGIDESQFFKGIKDIILHWVEDLNKIVYVAGLNCDYKRNVFGEIMDLAIYADSIITLKATCKCGIDAIFSKRLAQGNEQILVGSSEYEPVCRLCYNKKV